MVQKNNISLLRLLGLPVFSDVKELASLVHVQEGLVLAFVMRTTRFYKKYTIKKSDGRDREIRQPRKDLKGIQAWILRNILDNMPMSLTHNIDRRYYI